jgi:hypothetical protein
MESMDKAYWVRRYNGARRVPDAAGSADTVALGK